MEDMTDRETVEHLREYVKTGGHGLFSWPSDACDYDQHIAFVDHRNKNWHGESSQEFDQFILDYADMLEKKDNESERLNRMERRYICNTVAMNEDPDDRISCRYQGGYVRTEDRCLSGEEEKQ